MYLYLGIFNRDTICQFTKTNLYRDPVIALGRVQNDGIVPYDDRELNNRLKHKYKVIINRD